MESRFPGVWANEAGLTQCTSNLPGNAVTFVAPGTVPPVRAWAETRDDNGRTFQWLSKKDEGTGIGLAIVRKAAGRMGRRWRRIRARERQHVLDRT